ncbi:MAG: hypothetical protein OJF49_003691 [Ktedonobacterales bacterium]|jgi:hypothetical protein|nr:MAG: hypothetical protein OJF49_003691 [Ktedonobacterales bacterium]
MKNSAAPARVHEGDETKQRAGFFGSAPPIPGFNPRSEDAVAHRFRGIAPQWLVLGAGAVSILIYMGFVLAFPLTTWWNHPHTSDLANNINDMGRITGYSPFAAIGFVTAIVLLFACQFVAMLAGGKVRQIGPASRRDRFVRALILFLPLAFAAVMIWMQPVTTTDLYGYVARGYIQAHLHQNPMTNPASLLPGGLSVDRPPSPYGPLWLLVTWAISALGGEDLLANMLAYKLIGFVALALTIWLVDLLARAVCPERRLRVAALVGWCPLILFDSIGNAHNDLVMMVCVLAAFELMRRDHPRWAVFFFVIGALIKYVSIIFLPLWFVYELRRRIARATPEETASEVEDESETESPEGLPAVVGAWIRGAAATVRQVNPRDVLALLTPVALIGLPLTILAYAPYWHGLSTFTGLGQQLRPLYYNSSIVGFISGPLQIVVPSSQDAALDKTLRLIFYALFFIYAYMQTTRLWSMGRKMTLHDVLTAAAKITFAALLLITFWFQPWYVTWLIPLAALAREPFVRRQGTILALGALLTYAVGNFLFVNESDLAHDLFVQFFEIMVAFGPLLLLRAAPYESGWSQVVRRYLGMLGQGLTQRPIFWERVMVVLIVVVAALLRLIRLGNIFSTIPAGSNEASVLAQVGSDLRLGLADPQGLHGPFDALQALLVQIFGRTPFAVLLPSAIFGSLTVIAIYLLTFEIMRQGKFPGTRPVAILAALLAATSHWHVSLSRSGMELVVLPLLMCMALYWLLLALRSQPRGAQSASQAQTSAREERETPLYRARTTSTPLAERLRVPSIPLARRRMLYFILSGVCTGLACDLAPGLWLVPLIVAGFLGMWHLRRPKGRTVPREGLIALVVTTLIVGSPVIWQYLNRVIGFAPGSSFLAKTTVLPGIGPTPLSPPFWVVVARNIADVLNVLVSQDYTAGYPAVGGAPIIPLLLGPFFFIGLLVIVVRWRRFESLALLLLTALPLVASVAVGTPTGAIEAASVLPAMCIVPAYGLYVVGLWLSHLPIVLDRINGVRVFSTPEQIGRMLLLVFLVVSAIRTFFWYFEATLPAHQAQWTPSFIGSHLALIAPDIILSHLAAIFFR